MNILEKIRKDREDLTKPFAGMLELDDEEAEIRQLIDESVEADVEDLNDDSILY